MVKVIGVDFSGAKDDKNTTWVTQAVLQDNRLTIESCYPLSKNRKCAHNKLETLLAELSDDAIAAMDFPFATPTEFAHFWQPGAVAMPDLWTAAAGMELADFIARRNDFVARYREPRRVCDPPEASSCLHMANPNMVPMTFYGMQMLSRLWASERNFRAPPLDDDGRTGPTLLETMPGAALNIFGLPYEKYKDNSGKEALTNRQKILCMLSSGSGVELLNLENFRDFFIFSHDALDSLVAVVVAAKWKLGDAFRCPADEEREAAQLEGWLYAPAPPARQP